MIGYKKLPHYENEHSENSLTIEHDNNGIHYDFTIANSKDAVVSYRKEFNHSFCDRYTGYLSLEDLNRCTSSNRKIEQAHAIIGVGFRLKDKPRVFDFFRHTSESKSTTGHVVASTLGLQQGFYFAREWKDSPIEEWKVFLSARNITINGVMQNAYVETINGNGLNNIVSMLPKISIKYARESVFIQLLHADGSVAHKQNVEVYLETTTGLLQENRVVTNEYGQACTRLLFANKGKVKAGFKFYSGKAEIQID